MTTLFNSIVNHRSQKIAIRTNSTIATIKPPFVLLNSVSQNNNDCIAKFDQIDVVLRYTI